MMLDFDEILISIKNPQIKKYVEESVKSYQVGNYRSAILAVWIASMFDLVKKFEILVEQGEPTAINAWKKLKPKIEEHKNWEQQLIDAAKVAAMISSFEADKLNKLRETRNLYAHPSFDDVGSLHDPTPEEVRYFIRTLYDLVLSQPAQLGAFYVNQLLEAVKEPNFFRNKVIADELFQQKDAVKEQINLINPKQIPRLIKELLQALNHPISAQHELNVLCLIINLWNIEFAPNLNIEIEKHWNEYITNKTLTFTQLEALLSYPVSINKLSSAAQQAIESNFIEQSIKGRKFSQSWVSFLASVDEVPIAKSILDKASNLIKIEDVIKKSSYYSELFGSNFSSVFGKGILERTRQALKTRNGYEVNPYLATLRICGVWNVADSIEKVEQDILRMN